MKTAISIPDTLFHIAESLAERMGMSRSELYRHALENYIRAHRHDGVRESLDAVYAEESSHIDEVLAEMQWASPFLLRTCDWLPPPGNFRLDRRETGLSRDSVLNLSQVLTVDKSFLTERVGILSVRNLAAMDAGLKLVMGL